MEELYREIEQVIIDSSWDNEEGIAVIEVAEVQTILMKYLLGKDVEG